MYKNGTFRYVIKYCLGKLECECNLNQNPYERCPPSCMLKCDGITEENSIKCAIDWMICEDDLSSDPL